MPKPNFTLRHRPMDQLDGDNQIIVSGPIDSETAVQLLNGILEARAPTQVIQITVDIYDRPLSDGAEPTTSEGQALR